MEPQFPVETLRSRHGCVRSLETCLLSPVVLDSSLLCSVKRNYAEYVESFFSLPWSETARMNEAVRPNQLKPRLVDADKDTTTRSG